MVRMVSIQGGSPGAIKGSGVVGVGPMVVKLAVVVVSPVVVVSTVVVVVVGGVVGGWSGGRRGRNVGSRSGGQPSTQGEATDMSNVPSGTVPGWTQTLPSELA